MAGKGDRIGVFLTEEEWKAVQMAILARMVEKSPAARRDQPVLEKIQNTIDDAVMLPERVRALVDSGWVDPTVADELGEQVARDLRDMREDD
jgi:hypothetical protein